MIPSPVIPVKVQDVAWVTSPPVKSLPRFELKSFPIKVLSYKYSQIQKEDNDT